MAEVLRDGVLGIDGVERLIYQPDEIPTEPMAMPNGGRPTCLEAVGGFLPSLALTSDGAAAAMASDSRFAGALVAGPLRRRDRLPGIADRDDDDARRVRPRAVRAGPPGDRGAWR